MDNSPAARPGALASQGFDAINEAINASKAAAVDGSSMRLASAAATPEWHDAWRAEIQKQAQFHADRPDGDMVVPGDLDEAR